VKTFPRVADPGAAVGNRSLLAEQRPAPAGSTLDYSAASNPKGQVRPAGRRFAPTYAATGQRVTLPRPHLKRKCAMGTSVRIPANRTAGGASGFKSNSPTTHAASPSKALQSLTRPTGPADMPGSLLHRRRDKTDPALSALQEMRVMDENAWMSQADRGIEARNPAFEPTPPRVRDESTPEASEKAEAAATSPGLATADRKSAFASVPLIGAFKKLNPLLAITIDRIDARPEGKSAVVAGLGGFFRGSAHFSQGMGSAVIKGKASVPLMLASGYKKASEYSSHVPDRISQQSAEQIAEDGLSVLKKAGALLSDDR